MSLALTSSTVKFVVRAGQGSHPTAHASRSYVVHLRACVPPDTVRVNGEAVPYSPAVRVKQRIGTNTWHYDGARMAVVVTLNARWSVAEDVELELELPAGRQAALRPLMVGVQGKIARAQAVKPVLDQQYPKVFPEDYDNVVHLAEMGARASYDPAQVSELLSGFPALLKDAIKETKALKHIKASARKTGPCAGGGGASCVCWDGVGWLTTGICDCCVRDVLVQRRRY